MSEDMERECYDYGDEPDDDPECCDSCGGEGFYHDCGEDTCCCADPDEDDLVTCDECGGRGFY